MVQGKRLAKIEKLRQLNAVDFIFLAYLLGVVLIMVLLGWGHKYFNLVVVTHIVFTAVIFAFAYYVGPGSKPVLKFIRDWYPLPLLIYLYSESGLINNLVFDVPIDPMYIALEKVIFRCEPAVILPVKFNHRFLMEYFHLSYFTYYLYLPVIGGVLYFKDKQFFEKFLFTVSITLLSCYLLFIFFPAIGPIPLRTGLYRGFFTSLMDLIYRFDTPGGAFPSSHVAVVIVCMLMILRKIRILGLILVPFVASLIVATVYCRYHYAVDAAAGIIYAVLMMFICDFLYRRIASYFLGIGPTIDFT
jgi:membrane-associated phospholipid phosphatase